MFSDQSEILIFDINTSVLTRKTALSLSKEAKKAIFRSENLTKISNTCFYSQENWEFFDFSQCKNLRILEKGAFQNCTNLNKIILPRSIQKIEISAFRSCIKLTSLQLDEESDLTFIGKEAFYGSGIESFYIPPFVNSIGDGAFGCIFSLKEIIVDTNNINFEVIDGVLYSLNDKVCKAYTINITLNRLDIKTGILSIGANSFCYASINTIFIPSTVTFIGVSAFSNCYTEEFIFQPNNKLSIMLNRAFYGIQTLKRINLIHLHVLNTIQKECFAFCSNIQTLIFPEYLILIFESAFYNCSSLTSVTFRNESRLKALYDLCFANTNLSVFSLPINCQLHGAMQYMNCPITQFNISKNHRDVVVIDSIIYSRLMDQIHYYLPSLPHVKFKIPSSVQIIRAGSFYGTKNLQTIILHETLMHIGDFAFSNSLITKIIVPPSVSFIGISCFEDCSKLTYADLSGSFLSIPKFCFKNCNSLTNIILTGNITTIREGAFQGCDNIKCFTCSDKVYKLVRKMYSKNVLTKDKCPHSLYGIHVF